MVINNIKLAREAYLSLLADLTVKLEICEGEECEELMAKLLDCETIISACNYNLTHKQA